MSRVIDYPVLGVDAAEERNSAERDAAYRTARAVLKLPVDSLEATLIGLDLDRDGYKRDDGYDITRAVAWIREFRRVYEKLADGARGGSIPPVVVFADHLSRAEHDALHLAPAAPYDRSDSETQNFEQLLDRLRPEYEARTRVLRELREKIQAGGREEPPASAISQEQLHACNSYPPRVTQKDLIELMRVLNAE